MSWAPSSVYIDDNRSCMKHWRSGFFLIDRRAIPNAMVWRHPNAAIDDPRPAAGSFNMADVRRLSTHCFRVPVEMVGAGAVISIHDFLCLPEWTSAEVQEELYLDKQKASTSGAASSHVAKHNRSALAQSSSSTIRPSLFVGDDDDDDACVEISLVTPLCSATVIPSSGNQGGSFVAPTFEGSNTRDSRGKGIMVDDAAAPSGGVSRQRPSSGLALSFRDIFSDAIHTDFFPFFAGPYYATYLEDGVAGNCEFTCEEWDAPYRPSFGVLTKEIFKDHAVCKTIFDQFPTLGEMFRVEGLSDDQLAAKMSALHYIMMSHGCELLVRYRGLNQSHHKYVLSTDSRLKVYEEKVTGLTGLELQVSTLKKQVSGLNDKLATFDASFSKSKAKGKERKKKIKSLSKSVDNIILRLILGFGLELLASDKFSRVQGELLSLAASAGFECGLSMHRTKDEFADVLKNGNGYNKKDKNPSKTRQNRAQNGKRKNNSKYAAKPLSVILQLELEKLVRPASVPIQRDTLVSHPIAKDSTMTSISKSIELSANVIRASYSFALEQNEEQVSAAVDGSDLEMIDGATHSMAGCVFVQGTSHVLNDDAEVTVVGSERVSSGLTDVVVAHSRDKGDGSTPSSTVEEVVVPPSKV
nr:hypothetical protein [Tanacetum cinerariifolium]